MNLQAVTEQVCALAQEAGRFISKERENFSIEKVQEKSLNSLVSYVDVTAERMLVTGLQHILPEAGFITEENTIGKTDKEYKWIIDPLDGTTNFVHNIPVFAVSIALMKGEEIISGVVYEVNRKECFYAFKEGGAFLNGKGIKVSKTVTLSSSLIATGFPYEIFHFLEKYMKSFTALLTRTRGLRRLGAASVDLAYVACGRFDGFFEYNLNAWDIAAGAFIVQQAGGTVTDFSGGNDFIFGKEIIASNGLIHEEFRIQI